MNVTIRGLTAIDRMELERQLEVHGAEFREDDIGAHGQGDMGVFTVIVPVTAAVVSLLKKWIEVRAPLTDIELDNGVTKAKVRTNMRPEDLAEYLELLKASMPS